MKSVPKFAVVLCLLAGLVAIAVPSLLRARLSPSSVASRGGETPSVAASVAEPAHRPTAPAGASARTRLSGQKDEAVAGAPHAAAVAVPGGVDLGVEGGVVGGVIGGVPMQSRPPWAAQKVAREAEIDRVSPGIDTEAYDRVRDNPFLAVSANPLSTFSIDVDTASYANVRRRATSS